MYSDTIYSTQDLLCFAKIKFCDLSFRIKDPHTKDIGDPKIKVISMVSMQLPVLASFGV
jgi:hypothetical protein